MRSIAGLVVLLVSVPSALGQNVSRKSIAIESADGFILRCELLTPAQPGPGVLLLHQCDRKPEAATGYETLAKQLAELGCHVLMLDFRGYGESRDDRFTGENWQEAREFFMADVAAAYAYLANRSKATGPVGVVGASCGGRQAVQLLTQQPDRVQALVFLSAGLRGSFVELEGVPVFCAAARNDPFGSAAASMRRAHGVSGHKESRLQMYDGRLHGTPLLEAHPELVSAIAKWLWAQLGAAPHD